MTSEKTQLTAANPDNILSPLSRTSNVQLEEILDVGEIMDGYKKLFEFDVEYLFQGVNQIKIFKCLDSGYRFYHPFNIAGDDKFYNHFGKFPWYYLPWKWEHEECSKLIKEGDTVLEVGAASGNFLGQLMNLKQINCIGLELNSVAVKEANEKGIPLLNESIEDHALRMPAKYDVVCSFQVLEHIPNVGKVIESMVNCLKKGGILIISVPNNGSFIKDNPLPSRILNMPPHHMGLWSEDSLKNLCKFYPLTYLQTVIEPLQKIHADNYQFITVKRFLFNSYFLVRIYWKLRIHLLFRPLIKFFSKLIRGHSIMSVYVKTV